MKFLFLCYGHTAQDDGHTMQNDPPSPITIFLKIFEPFPNGEQRVRKNYIHIYNIACFKN